MRAELSALETELQNVVLPLDLPGVESSREQISALTHQLHDYLIPRYEQWDAPAIVVVGGSTGAGKSTLVNALVGEGVSPVSAIRPTTRVPVLVHHPADAEWFHTSTLLPRWVRTTSSVSRGEGAADEPMIRIHSSPAVPEGLALIDAPDIDSLDEANRQRSRELLDAADAWIFATTAMRYADAVPWEYLKDARDRNAVIMLVLGRTPVGHVAEVADDLTALLRHHGLEGTPVFTVTEKTAAREQDISPEELRPIADWLRHLTTPDVRDELVKQTAVGATAHVLTKVEQINTALEAQRTTAHALEKIVLEHFHTAAISEALKDGELLRGEVLKQWHEFLGTGEYLRRLEAGVGRVRDTITRLWRRPTEGSLKEELGQGFAGLVLATAADAAQNTYSAWQSHPGGSDLLEPHLATPAASLGEATREEVRRWQAGILELVRTHGGSKKTGARIAAFGVNAVAVLLMIVAFASTGGLVGAELAIAGGTAVVAQRVLEAIFGEHGMRQLAAQAQDDLLNRAGRLMDTEAQRYLVVIPDIPHARLDEAVDSVRRALKDLS